MQTQQKANKENKQISERHSNINSQACKPIKGLAQSTHVNVCIQLSILTSVYVLVSMDTFLAHVYTFHCMVGG